jgi:flagellar basal-body rod protein FlgG
MTGVEEVVHAAMSADMAVLRTLAQNVANAQTPGYQRAVPVLHTFAAVSQSVSDTGSTAVGALPLAGVATDLSGGPLRQTGRSLDLALEGDAYFVVDTGNGEALRRRGDFIVDSQGYLTTGSHETLLGSRGALHVGDGEVKVTPAGEVYVGTQRIDQLRVVSVMAKTALKAMGTDLWAVPEEGVTDSPGIGVRQGFLQMSNVEPVNEMVRMMETLRHFEALQRYFRVNDDLMSRAIGDLGKAPG